VPHGRWLRYGAAAVFKWGRGTRPVKFHLRHRLLGWNPLNDVGGPTGNRSPRPVVVESGWSELRRAA
jgi:hypothetical protein